MLGIMHVSSAGDLFLLDNAEGGPIGSDKISFAIVGLGRAGKIHLNALRKRDDVQVRWLVDACVTNCPAATNEEKITSELNEALTDPHVSCVIVSTPTPSHGAVIHAALAAGKHVFAEKPLCCDDAEVPILFAAAASRSLLLHTAYNRRHDPEIRRAFEEVRSRLHGEPFGATVVSRDFPYPTAAYLATSGNLFKDCVVHDLDYVLWLLDDEVASLRATASTSGAERACGMWEFSTVHLTLTRTGATVTLINARTANSYDHRLDVFCEGGTVRVTNPDDGLASGRAFSDRFAESYHAQLDAFIKGVRAVACGAAPVPNVSLERTMMLANLVRACERSVEQGGATVHLQSQAVKESQAEQEKAPLGADTKMKAPLAALTVIDEEEQDAAKASLAAEPAPASLRTYGDTTAARVKELYATMRRSQSVEHVRCMRAKYVAPGRLGSVCMSIWDALEKLASFVDVSDPDLTLPNHIHAFQTAEGLRKRGLPDWLQLTGLIHDCGKMIHVRGCDADGTSMAAQWSIVGDTWIVGCKMPDELVFPEFNGDSPDASHPERQSELGIYEEGCGLDAVLCAFGHDEYMYEVLRQTEGVKLPKEALYIIRYHSLYPWHDAGCYARLESEYDRAMKGWVRLFNQHDLYTKCDVMYSAAELAELRAYYATLVDKYLPAELAW